MTRPIYVDNAKKSNKMLKQKHSVLTSKAVKIEAAQTKFII